MKKLSDNLLHSLGLDESQLKVYLSALELGQANMQALARKSGVKRTSIYNFIDELKQKGLITETRKKKRRLYSATHPEQLVELEKTRLTELNRALPELMAVYNQSSQKPKVRFYEGIGAIEKIYNDQLKAGESVAVFGDSELRPDGIRPPANHDLVPVDSPAQISVYGNKTALINLASQPPSGLLIEDADIAKTLRAAWDKLSSKVG